VLILQLLQPCREIRIHITNSMKTSSSAPFDTGSVARTVEASLANQKPPFYQDVPAHFRDSINFYGSGSNVPVVSPSGEKSVDSWSVRNDSRFQRPGSVENPLFVSDFSSTEKTPQFPVKQHSKLLRWKADVAASPSTASAGDNPQRDCRHIGRSRNAHVNSSPTQSLHHKLKSIEAKIQKAARWELAYLNKAKEAQTKREEWMQLYKVVCDLQHKTNKNTPAGLLQKTGAKVKGCAQIEKAYLVKAKAVHDKRYRWTKLYEHASQMESQARIAKELPPLHQSLQACIEKELPTLPPLHQSV
jgi:hypothetical protein